MKERIKKTKLAKKNTKLFKGGEVILADLIAQFDVLVAGLCDPCCVGNYYRMQRSQLVDAMQRLTDEQVSNIGGIAVRYDTTGDDYADEEILLADTVTLSVFSTAGTDDFLPDLIWDGHLKPELCGHYQPTKR